MLTKRRAAFGGWYQFMISSRASDVRLPFCDQKRTCSDDETVSKPATCISLAISMPATFQMSKHPSELCSQGFNGRQNLVIGTVGMSAVARVIQFKAIQSMCSLFQVCLVTRTSTTTKHLQPERVTASTWTGWRFTSLDTAWVWNILTYGNP